eukprot:CAMPEP_0179277878 /NCGR_PEP_ID=MMETSP0797-20121207/35320_1 /TAXON_ID=47934 /ORGANISM="Dinophysis acuminata, Strain DAEP01" /LENGTH=338 /DNA_ID=CAMNT_0020986479 /DNA_START=335 /DNA_END=1351 /DNA_ORIENTATION=+
MSSGGDSPSVQETGGADVGTEELEADVVIVGGGPAGCTCALYTSRAGLKTVILDKSPSVGALARTEVIANYPGVDTTMNGQDLLDSMRDQCTQYGAIYRKAQVFLVDVSEGSKAVYSPTVTVKAKAIVLATGAMGREPTFKGEGEFLGKGVSYCATCDGAFYAGSEVAVIGSNPEAVEEAEFLTRFASTVHWITSADPSFDTDTRAADLLSMENVKHYSRTSMLQVEGDESGVTGVQLKEVGASGNRYTVPVEGAFIYISGSKPITDFIQGVELREDGGIRTDDQMQASVDGVYAIGDIRNTPFKQAVVACSDGCIAAMSIDRYLKGRKTFKVDWIHK